MTGEQPIRQARQGKELMAYCGLYCGDCFGYNGRIAELAKELRKELRHAKFDRIAESLAGNPFFEVFGNYSQCYDVLGALVQFRCKKTCHGGGGPPFCEIRKCCQSKELEGCWECDQFGTCDKLEFLKAGHGDAHLKNLRKLQRAGVDGFIEGKRYW